MSKETSGAASSTIEIADYVGMLAPLSWVHQDEDDRGAEEALRYATKGRLGAAPELDGELILNERYLTSAAESGEMCFHHSVSTVQSRKGLYCLVWFAVR